MILDELKKVSIFKNCDEQSLKNVAKNSYIKKYSAESIIFFRGDDSDKMHIVKSGVVRVYRQSEKATEMTLGFFKSGDVFGEFANFKEIPFPSNAEAMCESEIIIVDYSVFKQEFFGDEIKNNPVFISLFEKFPKLNSALERGAILGVSSKIAEFLLSHGELFSTMKNYHIASMLKITPETLSRTLKKLENDGLIKTYGRKGVEIVDIKRLQLIAEGS
ncbi:MAG: Crp/Fnr family transcriptional regulator [Campylobacterales bacterium]